MSEGNPEDLFSGRTVAKLIFFGLAILLAGLCRPQGTTGQDVEDYFFIYNNTDFTMEVTVNNIFAKSPETIALKPGESGRTHCLNVWKSSFDQFKQRLEYGMVTIAFHNADRGLTLAGPKAGELAAAVLGNVQGDGSYIDLKDVLQAMDVTE